MAKKKKETATYPVAMGDEEKRERTLAVINSKYGDVVHEANVLLDTPQVIIPIGPALDEGIHGGIPEGSWVLLSGPEKCGKTTTALQIASHAQQEEYVARAVYYLDAEGRYKKMNMTSVVGLRADKFFLVQSQEGKTLCGEDFLTIAIDIVKNHPRSVLIIDSASALCHSTTMEEDILNSNTRSPIPKLISAFCKTIGTVVPINKNIVIVINHLITNTGGGRGPKYMEDGGKKLQYQGDVRLRCTHVTPWKNNPNDTEEEPIGQILHWQVRSSALGKPGAKVDSYIRYGKGIDKLTELIKMSTDLGLISTSGSWYNCTFLEGIAEKRQYQGAPKLYQFLVDNPEYQTKLEKDYYELIS